MKSACWARSGRMHMNRKMDEVTYKALIVAPLLILLSVTLFPFLFVLVVSFFKVRSYNLDSSWEFAGIQNYLEVFSDRENITSVLNTVLYIIYALGVEFIIGMAMAALLLYVKEKYRFSLILPFLIPLLLAPIVVAMLWKQVLAYDGGLLNRFLSIFSLEPVVWLSPEPLFGGNLSLQQSLNMTHGFISLLLVEIWQWTPLFVAGFLVSFSILRKEIIQSAVMDGASPLRIFTDIYFPMAKPLLYGLVLLRVMDMLKVYETIWVFFGNSPAFANINIRMVTTGIDIRNYSYCSAFSIVVFLLIFIVLILGRLLLERAGRLYYAD